jgi:hypothetical protein
MHKADKPKSNLMDIMEIEEDQTYWEHNLEKKKKKKKNK